MKEPAIKIVRSFLLLPLGAALLYWTLWPLLKTAARSFQTFNVLEKPKPAGWLNYGGLFQNDVIGITVGNLVFLMSAVALIAGTAALLLRKPLKKAVWPVRVSAVASLNLLSALLLIGAVFPLPFGDGSFLRLLAQNVPLWAVLLHMILIVFGPLSAAVLLTPDAKPGIFTPVRGSLRIYAAYLLPLILVPAGAFAQIYLFGYPSSGYQADTLVTQIYDYMNIRYELGFAAALKVFLTLLLTGSAAVGFPLLLGLLHLYRMFAARMPEAGPANMTGPDAAHASDGRIRNSLLAVLPALAVLPLIFAALCSGGETVSALPQPSLIRKLIAMLLAPLLPSLLLTAGAAAAAAGYTGAAPILRKIWLIFILLCMLPVPANLFMEINPNLVNANLPQAFTCVFTSFLPAASFLYLTRFWNKAGMRGQSKPIALLLGCIPVLLLSYVACFISPIPRTLNYDNSFSSFSLLTSYNVRPDKTALLLLCAFILAAALSAALAGRERENTAGRADGAI